MTEAFCYLLSISALLPRTYGRSWCPPWTPAYSVRPPTAPGAWYNHLGVRPGVLGARLAGLSLVKFCLLEDCDCEECPRGSTATTASIASVGGLQINSQRLFAPKLAEGHHGGSGIRRRHGSVHGLLPREIIRRRKSIVQEQVGFLAKRVVFGSSSSCKHILNEIMTTLAKAHLQLFSHL